jgi:RNA polymerase sigma factor (sigma-70 family)
MTTTPCGDCGTTGGYVPSDCRRPIRSNGEPFGFRGTLCRACHRRHTRLKAAPPKTQKQRRLEGGRFDLVASNLELAETAARYWDAQCNRLSGEFISAAYWGLIAAAFKFPDSAPRDQFPYFAMARIKGECLDLIAGGKRRRSYEPLPMSTLPSDEDQPGWALESIDAIEGLTQDLPPTPREVARLRYCYGLPLAEIGERLDLNISQVDYHCDRALAALRKGAA